MLPLQLVPDASRTPRILCLGAHCDDVEIGAGGTVRRLLAEYPGAHVRWVVFCSQGVRGTEARRSAEDFLEAAGEAQIDIHEYRASFLPERWAEVKATFEDFKGFDPDVILTHHGRDAHQDHRTVSELTWNTFRNHLVLEYEIQKYDADLGQPNLFVSLTREQGQAKIDSIQSHFESQRGRQWFDDESFWSLMRLRGIECNSSTRYAEAFHVRKMKLFSEETSA